MKSLLKFITLVVVPMLCFGCYSISVEIGNINRSYKDDEAVKQDGVVVCGLEPIIVKCGIHPGPGRVNDKNELVAKEVGYQIRVRRGDGYEYVPHEGLTSNSVEKVINISGHPPGVTRVTLWIKDGAEWEEQDNVKLPIRASIPPVSLTLSPNDFNSLDTRQQSWEGLFAETSELQTGRSTHAVIDNVILGGGHPYLGADALDIEFAPTSGGHTLVGLWTIEGFRPTGNIRIADPNGRWIVRPSNTPPYSARSWSEYDWNKVGNMSLMIHYSCSP